MKQDWIREPNRDWTYSEGCGCKVTFFAAAGYRTSRMLPGDECRIHATWGQAPERDLLVERAKQSLQEYLSLPLA